MFYTNNISSGRGLSESNGQPRLVGAILTEMLRSDSRLAQGYRAYVAQKENNAEKGGVAL